MRPGADDLARPASIRAAVVPVRPHDGAGPARTGRPRSSPWTMEWNARRYSPLVRNPRLHRHQSGLRLIIMSERIFSTTAPA